MRAVLFVGLSHVTARAAGAFAGLVFPSSGSRGLLFTFKDAAASPAAVILVFWLIACSAASVVLSPAGGILCTAASALLLWRIRVMSRREFGGMSGDLAGYTVSLAELIILFVYIFAGKAVALCF